MFVACGPLLAPGQGTFIYDQQSSDETNLQEGGAHLGTDQPAQSFIPALSSVGFIRLFINDVSLGNGVGGTVYLNLRQSTLSGPILASTQPVTLPDSFGGTVSFYFDANISVTAGQPYFFEPILQTGDDLLANVSIQYNYAGGTAYLQGQPASLGKDMWFREGIIPEPGSIALLSFGSAIWLVTKSKRQTNKGVKPERATT